MVGLILSVSMLTLSCKKDRDSDFKISNQEFVTQASNSNSFEVAAGALAQTKGTNAAVKLYGQHMVTDHTAAGMELKTLADRKNWTVPTGLSPVHQQNLLILSSASNAEFDARFAQLMVQSHQEAVSLFETASADRGVPDVELRSLASAKLPTLKAHLQEALTLQTAVAP